MNFLYSRIIIRQTEFFKSLFVFLWKMEIFSKNAVCVDGNILKMLFTWMEFFFFGNRKVKFSKLAIYVRLSKSVFMCPDYACLNLKVWFLGWLNSSYWLCKNCTINQNLACCSLSTLALHKCYLEIVLNWTLKSWELLGKLYNTSARMKNWDIH